MAFDGQSTLGRWGPWRRARAFKELFLLLLRLCRWHFISSASPSLRLVLIVARIARHDTIQQRPRLACPLQGQDALRRICLQTCTPFSFCCTTQQSAGVDPITALDTGAQ